MAEYESWRNWAAWWCLGLANNAAYVVFLTAAESIVSGDAGAVLAADILPTLLVKVTAPLWAHHLPYNARYALCTGFGALSLIIVATCEPLWLRLLGVCLASLGAGWGEITSLSLLAFYKPSAVTAWSSGTGMAGPAGAGYYVVMRLAGMSNSITMLVGLIFPALFASSYFLGMTEATVVGEDKVGFRTGGEGDEEAEDEKEDDGKGDEESLLEAGFTGTAGSVELEAVPVRVGHRLSPAHGTGTKSKRSDSDDGDTASLLHSGAHNPTSDLTQTMTVMERLGAAWALLPVMACLAIVYLAEYLINTGVVGTLSFPADDIPKQEFYRRAQLTYQFGVFFARSSGMLFPIDTLWPLPLAQVIMLAWFIIQSMTQAVASSWLMLVFVAVEGLFGGLVYVNAFRVLREQSEPSLREFNLGVASMADTIGITIAAGVSIWLEHTLDTFRAQNGLPTA